MARLVQMIESKETRGAGVLDNPVRVVTRWFDVEGDLLCEDDPHNAILDDGINLAMLILKNPDAKRGGGDFPHAMWMQIQSRATRYLERHHPESLDDLAKA